MAIAAFKRWKPAKDGDGAQHTHPWTEAAHSGRRAGLERSDAFDARRERHVGRIEASIEALAIARLAAARLSCARRPDEASSAEDWRRFGEAASAALEELSARMVQLASQMSEETELLGLERRSRRGVR